MSERQLQFRVGLFVVFSMIVGAVLVLQFSELRAYWEKSYPLAIHFDEAPGLYAGSPVKQNGIGIGRVKEVVLDDVNGGVLVVVEIDEDRHIRVDSQVTLVQSLLGDAKLEFTAGKAAEMIPPNSRLKGTAPTNPMEIVHRLEQTVNTSLASFTDTSREWHKVGQNLNNLMETKEGSLDDVIERTALALESFTKTMTTATATFDTAGETLESATLTLSNANKFLADPQLQADLKKTAASLPVIAEEAKLTITTAKETIIKLSENMENINQATAPLAGQSDLIVKKLSGSLIQLEGLLTELNQFSQILNDNDGTIQQLASDPELYKNLNHSAASLSILLTNLNPILKDFRIFSDRIARHPEILGVRGAVRGSSGLKESSEIQPAGFSAPQR
ncbi:MlaD family protein [Thalassoglobus polymorphus]|uniref:Mce related protein n=1 Tax=Thalassoglobus polymorphus TaxID=2527994 RepID=A0A517QGM9_9PLAN|nr:MlaD family protein [Thalassoglobus polymorphus]QDT30798.1 mce related protein [Thalassoglobus polymorphus]